MSIIKGIKTQAVTAATSYGLKKVSGILILVTILVGFCVTKNWLISVCVGLILGNIYVSLNNVMDKPKFVEKFKNPSKNKNIKKKK